MSNTVSNTYYSFLRDCTAHWIRAFHVRRLTRQVPTVQQLVAGRPEAAGCRTDVPRRRQRRRRGPISHHQRISVRQPGRPSSGFAQLPTRFVRRETRTRTLITEEIIIIIFCILYYEQLPVYNINCACTDCRKEEFFYYYVKNCSVFTLISARTV